MKSVIRRLSPVETCRLMGFDGDGYLDVDGALTKDSPRYKACGNSWGVNSAEWVNFRIERVMRELGYVANDRAVQYATTCSGVEAHSQAVKDCAWNASFFSEIEPFPCRVLAHHYPHVPNLGDMTKVDGTKYDLDVFSGGTPCQSVSVAGKRHGMAENSGTRSSLAFHWLRIGREARAKILLWENVPGALSSNGGRDFAWFLWRIVEAGYAVAWRVLDMQHNFTMNFPRAIPQRRRRIWLVASADGDWRTPARILFERSSRLGTARPMRVLGDGTVVDDPKAKAAPCDDLFSFAANAPHFTRASRADMIPIDLMPREFNGVAAHWLGDCGEVRHYGAFFANESATASPDGLDPKLLKSVGAGAGVAFGNRICSFKTKEWNAGIQMPWGETGVPDAFNGTVCGLSDVLLPWGDYLGKYLLSKRACEGIQRRMAKRGKVIPLALADALKEQVNNWDAGALDRYLKREGLVETENGDDEGEYSSGERDAGESNG